MDATFAKKSENTMSAEYAHLQQVRRDYPTYKVIRHTIKCNAEKKTYKGLTYEYMEYYILTHGTKEERQKNFAEYNEMILISKCHGKGFYVCRRNYEADDIRLLAECVYAAKFINEGQAKRLL